MMKPKKHPPADQGITFTKEQLAALLQHAGGNPFMLEEAIASVRMSQDPDAAQTFSLPSDAEPEKGTE